MIEWIFHIASTDILSFWWIITICFCILTGITVYLIGAVCWWNTKRGNLTKLWNRQRKEYKAEIEELTVLLEQANESLSFYKHRAFVKTIQALRDIE
jgi:uncharacterized iron-regulated membrane protein